MIKGVDHLGIGIVVLCHDGNGRYLVGLRSDKCRDEHFTWEPIGCGGIEHGDSVQETIHKEVKEECGAEVLEVEELGWYETFREHNGRKTHWIQFAYKARIDPSQASITEPDKCLEQRWCGIDDIPEPSHSQFPGFIKRYKDRL